MAAETHEVVSVQRVDEWYVRVGLAPIGRIRQYSQQNNSTQPNNRGTVPPDLYQTWPQDQQPMTGQLVEVTFAKTPEFIEVRDETVPETPES